jgi:hypothetical protein
MDAFARKGIFLPQSWKMEGTRAFMQACAGWLEKEAGNCRDSTTRGVIPGNTCGWNKAAALCMGFVSDGNGTDKDTPFINSNWNSTKSNQSP